MQATQAKLKTSPQVGFNSSSRQFEGEFFYITQLLKFDDPSKPQPKPLRLPKNRLHLFSQKIDVMGPADRGRFDDEIGSVPISSPQKFQDLHDAEARQCATRQRTITA